MTDRPLPVSDRRTESHSSRSCHGGRRATLPAHLTSRETRELTERPSVAPSFSCREMATARRTGSALCKAVSGAVSSRPCWVESCSAPAARCACTCRQMWHEVSQVARTPQKSRAPVIRLKNRTCDECPGLRRAHARRVWFGIRVIRIVRAQRGCSRRSDGGLCSAQNMFSELDR